MRDTCHTFLRCIILLFGIVTGSLSAQEAQITEVIAYHPAPCQFMESDITASQAIASYDQLLQRAQRRLIEEHQMLSLGGWGGYIVVRLQPALVNHAGQADFAVRGNAFVGNAEPGIVYVSQDANANGVADDPWYRIRGSEDDRSIHHYQVTYYKPKDPYNDPIAWSDSEGETGWIPRNKYHANNSYYPLWEGDKVSFEGIRLPNCMEYDPKSNKWSSRAFDYGYADNHPNDSEGCRIDIDSAVNDEERLVALEQIDFVKIQTGVHQQNEETGEISTEFAGITPLPKGLSIESPESRESRLSLYDNYLYVESERHGTLYLYDVVGALLLTRQLPMGSAKIPLPTSIDSFVVVIRSDLGSSATYRICRQ